MAHSWACFAVGWLGSVILAHHSVGRLAWGVSKQASNVVEGLML